MDITFNPTGENNDTFHQVHERHGSIKEDPTIKTFDEDVKHSLSERNRRPRYTPLGLRDKRKLEKSVLFQFLKEKREESAHEAASSSRNSDELPCFLAYLDGRKRDVRGKFYLDNVKHVLHVAFSPIDSFYPDNFLPTSAMLTFH